jgi:hypothetical protein
LRELFKTIEVRRLCQHSCFQGILKITIELAALASLQTSMLPLHPNSDRERVSDREDAYTAQIFKTA